jgi:hypothetical protein
MKDRRALDAATALRGRDIVCFSNDWNGDPLSKTHLMKILARENRILWVNSVGNRRPTASARDLRRIVEKLRDVARGITEPWPNIHVLGPLAVPAYGELGRALNRRILRAQSLAAMRKLHFTRPISWSFLPASAPVSGTLGEELVVYHCVDEFSKFTGTPERSPSSRRSWHAGPIWSSCRRRSSSRPSPAGTRGFAWSATASITPISRGPSPRRSSSRRSWPACRTR